MCGLSGLVFDACTSTAAWAESVWTFRPSNYDVYMLFVCWCGRNRFIFDGFVLNQRGIVGNFSTALPVWSPPSEGFFKVNCDVAIKSRLVVVA